LTWLDFQDAVDVLSTYVRPGATGIFGEARGGLPLAVALSHRTTLPYLREPDANMIWVDDIIDSGETFSKRRIDFPRAQYLAWVGRTRAMGASISIARIIKSDWIVFPWEDKAKAARDRTDYLKRRETANALPG
jgi:hypothetical protein